MVTILTAQGLTQSFGTRRVLQGVSFAMEARDRIGLVGVNGAGKSTLLKLLAGQVEPDGGLLTRRRDLVVEYVPQEPRLELDRTVGETVRDGQRALAQALQRLEALGEEIPRLEGERLQTALETQAALHERIEAQGGYNQEHAVRSIAAALMLPALDRAVANLSLGERRRVALARALLGRPELLILDEPTNHLDARTIEWLETELTAQPGALLLVTHDRYFLDRVANRILELDRGTLYAYEGNYTRFLEKQAERLEQAAGQERARASFVRNELDWIRRGPKARGTKQQARIDRFDDALTAGQEFAARGPHDRKMALRLPGGGRLGKTILELRDLGKSLGGKLLFRDLTLVVKGGDRIGVVGPNGVGKTTLVRTLLGLEQPDAGEVVVGLNTRFAFLDQGRAELRDDRTVLQEVAGDTDRVELEDGSVQVRTFLKMMLFDDGFADTPVGALSGGERSRVQLAKLLRSGGNFVILDEPTNDLDLVTLGVLEEALCAFTGCALVVSHDRWFLDRVATAILAFEGDGRVTLYEGDHDAYLRRRPSPLTAAAPTPEPARKSRPPRSGPRRLTFKEKEELAAIEGAVTVAESKAAALEASLADPAVYRERAAEVPSMVAALAQTRAEVERLYARWQELDTLAKSSEA